MKTKNRIYWILLSLSVIIAVSVFLIRTTASCVLHIYYTDESGATIKFSKTYTGKWLNTVNLSTDIPGYKLKGNVDVKQRFALKTKKIFLKYKVARTKSQINSDIKKAKYVGVTSQLMSSNRLKNKQEDPQGNYAYLRVITSNNGTKWSSQALNYPNVNIRNPHIYKVGSAWYILSDNMIMSTTDFVNWNISNWPLSQKKYAGIYSPNLITWNGNKYIVYQSWANKRSNNKYIYYSKYNATKASLSQPKRLKISKSAAVLNGFSVNMVEGKLVLIGVDTSSNEIVGYKSDGLFNSFDRLRLKQSSSIDNLSTASIKKVGNKRLLYYSSFRFVGDAVWRNNIKYTEFNEKNIKLKNTHFVKSDVLLENLNIVN